MNITLYELLDALEERFVVEGREQLTKMPLDLGGEVVSLVAATREGLLNITLKRRD